MINVQLEISGNPAAAVTRKSPRIALHQLHIQVRAGVMSLGNNFVTGINRSMVSLHCKEQHFDRTRKDSTLFSWISIWFLIFSREQFDFKWFCLKCKTHEPFVWSKSVWLVRRWVCLSLVRILVAFSQRRINATGYFWEDRLLAYPEINNVMLVKASTSRPWRNQECAYQTT